MKCKIIDYTYNEAFISLEDDTVIKVPLSQVSNYLSLGTTINISANSNLLSSCNNLKPILYNDKLIDYF